MTGYYSGPLLWALWTLLAAIVLVGGLVVLRAIRAQRAHPSTPLLLLASGLFMIAVGMPASWMFAYEATDNILWCSLSALVAILLGFLLVLFSLQTRRA